MHEPLKGAIPGRLNRPASGAPPWGSANPGLPSVALGYGSVAPIQGLRDAQCFRRGQQHAATQQRARKRANM